MDDGDRVNIGCPEGFEDKHPGGCRDNNYALRDIEVGEELLEDYGSYVLPLWDHFGL